MDRHAANIYEYDVIPATCHVFGIVIALDKNQEPNSLTRAFRAGNVGEHSHWRSIR